MSFAYPVSSESILKGQNFYRIRAPISILFGGTKEDSPENFSIGDLAPIDSPVFAVAVGPDSDFFRYEIIYPDQLAQGGVNTAVLTPVNPLVLPAGVDLSTQYVDTSTEKKIFIRACDWLPNGGQVTQPIIDLIVYTKTPPTVYPTKRTPKKFTLATELSVGTVGFRFPVSGRQEASMRFFQSIGGAAISWAIEGRKIFGYQGGTPSPIERFEVLPSTAVPAATPQPFADGLFTYTPQVHGYYDELEVLITSDTVHDPSSSDTAFALAVLDIQLRD